MQNVFPARELYNSNPCRDMWDSEQLSQMAPSCSQGSQNSSSDMFSQSRMSQLKGFSSFDVWSQPMNSQQMPEDEPVKYYMKYMTKPPLFSSESERQSQKKQKPQTASYKELIEIQKKKTAERDDRDVLDSFISLLKDYTKEVKTAMDSFKDSIDTTLASKAEQVATAASQSADLIKKLKDDVLESFGCLRKDLKENEELKEVISKQNEEIAEKDSHIKMLQAQLEDCRAREVKSLEKHEKYMEREDKLLQKLDEISRRQTPAQKTRTSTVGNPDYNQASECGLQYSNEGCVPQNPPMVAFQNQFAAWNGTEVPNSVRLHHMAPQPPPAPHPYIQSISRDSFNSHMQGSNYNRHVIPSLDYQYLPQSSLLPISEADAVVPCVNIQYQANMALAAQHQPNVHPTAAIAPMQNILNDHQQPLCQQERNINEPVMPKGDQAALRPELDVAYATEKHPQETNRAFTSPGIRGHTLTKAAWPKQSPVAAVHPQIRVKSEDEEQKKKVAGPPCAKRVRKEDPFDIFVFDLTSSPEEEICDIQKTKPTLLKPVPKGLASSYITRSKTMTYVKNTNEQKTTENIAESDEMINHQQSKATTKGYLTEKLSSVKESDSKPRGNASPASKHIEVQDRDDKARGYNGDATTPNRPVKACLENGFPRSKVAQTVFQRSKSSFKRNIVAAKRKLSFDASELFDGLEDNTNIQQITESIRKHAQRKRAEKVL